MLQAQVLNADAMDLCVETPAMRLSTLGELGDIVNAAVFMLSSVVTSPQIVWYHKAEAEALYLNWRNNWVPYEKMPSDYATEKYVPPEIQERFCELIVRTAKFADKVYMADRAGAVAENYGDFLRALATLRERVFPSAKPKAASGGGVMFFVGAIVLAGALGVGVAHFRRRRPVAA